MRNYKCRGQRFSNEDNHISEEHTKRNETETKDVIRENFSYENKDLDF